MPSSSSLHTLGPAPAAGAPARSSSSGSDTRGARVSDILALLFRLRHQRLVEDYSCAISASIILHGRMYVTEDCVAFYSNIFGKETRKILPFSRMTGVRKKTAFVLPVLEFTVESKAGELVKDWKADIELINLFDMVRASPATLTCCCS